MTNEVKLYKLKSGFAKRNKFLSYFVAKVLIETQKAVYLYGRGSGETTKMGVCCMCGRTLTHPVSVLLGIGPECGGHFHDWKAVGGYSEANLEKLKVLLKDIKMEGWIPKSQIIGTYESEEIVEVPFDHPKARPTTPIEKSLPDRYATIAKNDSGLNVIKLMFKYDVEMIHKVRELPGRVYHPQDKCWSAPIHQHTITSLKGWGFVIDQKLEEYIKQEETKAIIKVGNEISGLGGELRPFQIQGVSFIENKNGRALIGDEMGLGKTVQALAWMQLHKKVRPVVIVVPASLKLNWQREAEKWLENPNICVLSGTTPSKITKDIIIINYDILIAWIGELKKLKPQLLILDESHYIKNNKAKRTKAVKSLAKGIPHIIALSGTPIINRPVEMYNVIKLINPDIFPNYMAFALKFCNAHQTPFGWDVSGVSNAEELHRILTNTIMLRRKKMDVLTELPDKVYTFTPIELNNNAEYINAENNFIAYVRETKGDNAALRASNVETLAKIEGLKQLAVKGKLKQSIEWIKDFLDTGNKLVVFCTHKFVINELMNEFKMAVKIDGSVSTIQRQEAVDQFQTNPNVNLFIGNIQAAGVGITLTAASNVAFLELPWTSGALVQAEDRCHRIGQKDSVNVYYLLAKRTIEEKIAQLLDEKRKVLDAVLDGMETSEENLLSSLMNEYNK